MLFDRFAFWAVVTKKVSKAQSLVEFKKIGPDEELLAVMIDKAQAYYRNRMSAEAQEGSQGLDQGASVGGRIGVASAEERIGGPARRLRVWRFRFRTSSSGLLKVVGDGPGVPRRSVGSVRGFGPG